MSRIIRRVPEGPPMSRQKSLEFKSLFLYRWSQRHWYKETGGASFFTGGVYGHLKETFKSKEWPKIKRNYILINIQNLPLLLYGNKVAEKFLCQCRHVVRDGFPFNWNYIFVCRSSWALQIVKRLYVITSGCQSVGCEFDSSLIR